MEKIPFNVFYNSKVGMIEITGKDGFIEGIRFIDQMPGEKEIKQPDYMRECLNQLDEYFSYKRKEFTVPIRLSGTDFQKRVWNELLNIPYGTTISYLKLAERLGDQKVIRAAASANGKNKIAILVPCHRVIGNDGRLVGYAGGLWRKKNLLNHEQGIDDLTLF